jgi:hypothetical protein
VKLQLSKRAVLKGLRVSAVHVDHEPADEADLDYSQAGGEIASIGESVHSAEEAQQKTSPKKAART